MDIITQTIYKTGTGFLSFTPTATIETVTTVTTEYEQTYTATLGQSITILLSGPGPIATSSVPSAPTSDITRTETVTEIAIVLQDTNSNPYSTWTVPLSTTSPNDPLHSQLSPYLLVINPQQNDSSSSSPGWDSWNSAQKGGLIAGVAIAFLLIVGVVLLLLSKRRGVWLANDWSVRSHPDWGMHEPGQMMVYSCPVHGHGHA